MSWDSWAPFAQTSSPLPRLPLGYVSVHLGFNFSRLCSLRRLPVVLRWILWTMSAAQRTSSLRRACRTWETSTTSARAPVECQSTSAPFVGTAPQVMSRREDGGAGIGGQAHAPTHSTQVFHPDKWKAGSAERFVWRLAGRFMSVYVDLIWADVRREASYQGRKLRRLAWQLPEAEWWFRGKKGRWRKSLSC